MTKPNSTEIIVILDRSGSMHSIAADMRGGFDQFIEDQRKEPGECTVTLAQFDHEHEMVYSGRPIADVPALTLSPRGKTALFDAVGRTINATGERLAAMPERDRPSKVIVLIITDGAENASREFKRGQVAEMVKHQREAYGWDFVYLGANQDALAVAAQIGVDARSAGTYEATGAGTRGMMNVVHCSVATSRLGGDQTVIPPMPTPAVARPRN